MSTNLRNAIITRFDNSGSQEKLRIIEQGTVDINPFHPSIDDLKDFGCSTVIKYFQPLTLGICAGQEITSRIVSRVKRKISGI